MNNAAKRVIRTKKQFILENFILNDGILDNLEDNGILTEEMIQQINAEKTDYQKIKKLLYILKRRGPTAFEHFVEAIRQDFSFVSEVLETEYAKELDNANNNDASFPEATNQEQPRNSSDESMNTIQTESENLNVIPTSSTGTQTFEVERNGTSDFILERNNTSDFMQRMMQESFTCWYTKIKSHMTNRNLREPSFISPQPITFDMVDQLIDEMISIIEGCHKALRVKDNLVTHVIELTESRKNMKKELEEKERLRNKYAHDRMKLENKCRDTSDKLGQEIRNNQKLHAELENLKEKLDTEIKEKNEYMETLKQQLEHTTSKTNKGIMTENVQKVKTERKNKRDNADNYESETEKKVLYLSGQGTLHESKRSRSIEDNKQRKHISFYKSTPRRDKSQRNKSSDITKHVRKMQHSNGRESKELTAVEEPDGVRLARTQSFIESYRNQRTTPLIKSNADQSENSDNENNIDSDHLNGEIHQDENEQQRLKISNTSNQSNILTEETEFSRQARGRRNSQRIGQTRKKYQRHWIGTNENNPETHQRTSRNAQTEVKGLSSLVIINNSKCTQNESPRGAKVMKQY